MDKSLSRLLGLDGGGTAIYRYADGQVAKEDFEYAKVIETVLFDDKVGYIATLGPTWNMVHDPRFVKIENSFVIIRNGMFGGNANVGQSIVGEDGLLGGQSNDLERYAEMLGEGRTLLKAVRESGLDPQKFADNEGFIWTLLRGNYPNWFRQNGTPNKEATRLFNMCAAGLVGLIADYAELPLADEWVNAESGDLLSPADHNDPDVMGVYLEVDQLDKAINARTQLRLLAARVLQELGLARQLKGEENRLTDQERDELLRIIYQSNWPEDKPMLMANLLMFIGAATKKPFEERLRDQLALASQKSQAVVEQLRSGELKTINRVNEEVSEWKPEESTSLIDEIMRHPLKRHLFPTYTQAEKMGKKDVVDLLAPIFATANAVLDDTNYFEIVAQLEKLTKPLPVTKVEEEFHSAESPFKA